MRRKTGAADVDGARLRYESAGEGESLVLVHAGIADMRMREPHFDRLARGYRVVRYDMRGHGGTVVMAGGPYSHHEDLRALLGLLGLGRASLVGCSMGAKTVLDLALEHPEVVGALVLVAPAVGGFEPDVAPPEEWGEMVAAEEVGDLERLSKLEVRAWVDGPRRGPDAVDPSVRELVREMNLLALENGAAGLGEERPLEPPAAGRLSEVRAPTLVAVGDRDRPEILAAADLLEGGLPDARKVVIPATAHLPNSERPEPFERIVFGFPEE